MLATLNDIFTQLVRYIHSHVYSIILLVCSLYIDETKKCELLQHLRKQLTNKKMIYSKNQLQLSTTVGQGSFCVYALFRYYMRYKFSGESGLVYKAYINTAIGKELVAVKTGKGKVFIHLCNKEKNMDI